LSPRLIVPGSTTRACSPRSRSARPVGDRTKSSAVSPKRLENLPQPLWMAGVTSRTVSPTAKQAPIGRFSSLRSKST
jgi:hypothetical protein